MNEFLGNPHRDELKNELHVSKSFGFEFHRKTSHDGEYLSSFRRLVNLFNRTLVILAIIDNVYIICDLLESFHQFRPEPTNSNIIR